MSGGIVFPGSEYNYVVFPDPFSPCLPALPLPHPTPCFQLNLPQCRESCALLYQFSQLLILQILRGEKKPTWTKQNNRNHNNNHHHHHKKTEKAKQATPFSQCWSMRRISIKITGGHINKNRVLSSYLWLFTFKQIRIFLCTKSCLQPQQQHDQKDVDVHCLNLPF